ncbi:MAG: hypothetical protein U0841_15755 [Chloroflexia bacterium]
MVGDGGAGGGAHGGVAGGVGEDGGEGGGEGGVVADGDGGGGGGGEFGEDADGGADDREAAGGGFEWGHRLGFVAGGEDEEVARLVEPGELVVGDGAEEGDGVGEAEVGGELAQAGFFGAFTGDGEGDGMALRVEVGDGAEEQRLVFDGDEEAA